MPPAYQARAEPRRRRPMRCAVGLDLGGLGLIGEFNVPRFSSVSTTLHSTSTCGEGGTGLPLALPAAPMPVSPIKMGSV